MPANAVELNGCGETVAKDWVKARSVHCFGESICAFIDQFVFLTQVHPLIIAAKREIWSRRVGIYDRAERKNFQVRREMSPTLWFKPRVSR